MGNRAVSAAGEALKMDRKKRPGVILNPEPGLRCLVNIRSNAAVNGVSIRHDQNTGHGIRHKGGKMDGTRDDRKPRAGSIQVKNTVTAQSYTAAHNMRVGNTLEGCNKPVADCKQPVAEHNKMAVCNTPAAV